MNAFSPARPSTRSRSHLRTMSATSRPIRRTRPRGRGRAASAAVAAARASALRRCATWVCRTSRPPGSRWSSPHHGAAGPAGSGPGRAPGQAVSRRTRSSSAAGSPAAVAVAGEHPQRRRRAPSRRSAAARTRPRAGPRGSPVPPAAVERHLPQPLPAQRGDVERAADDRGAARAGLRGLQVTTGAAKRPPPSPAPSTSGQPPLSPSRTWLTSSKRFCPNSVAHSRPSSSNARPCTLRWPRENTSEPAPRPARPVRGHPQHLAAERVRVLRERGVAGVAGAGVQRAVGAEREPPAVVDRALRDAGEDRLGLAGRAARAAGSARPGCRRRS